MQQFFWCVVPAKINDTQRITWLQNVNDIFINWLLLANKPFWDFQALIYRCSLQWFIFHHGRPQRMISYHEDCPLADLPDFFRPLWGLQWRMLDKTDFVHFFQSTFPFCISIFAEILAGFFEAVKSAAPLPPNISAVSSSTLFLTVSQQKFK